MNWIKCSERMPQTRKHKDSELERSTDCLIWSKTTHRSYRATLVKFPDGDMLWDTPYPFGLEDVTHWMPIIGPDDASK